MPFKTEAQSVAADIGFDKHTPGPWHRDGAGNVCADNGRAILCLDYVGGETEEECRGNANLFIAAPDLLAYAEMEQACLVSTWNQIEPLFIANGYDESKHHDPVIWLGQYRRSAIAKARG